MCEKLVEIGSNCMKLREIDENCGMQFEAIFMTFAILGNLRQFEAI